MTEENNIFDWEDNFDKIDFSNNEPKNQLQSNINETYSTDLLNDNCPKCKEISSILIDNGYLICKSCGEQYSIIDKKPDWKISNDESYDKHDRCGGPVNSFLPKSSLGSSLSGNYSWAGRTQMPYNEHTLWKVCSNLELIGIKNGLNSFTIKEAQNYYRIISSLKHLTGKNKGKTIITRAKKREALIASCLYHAIQHNKIAITHKKVAGMFNLESKDLTKGIKRFEELLSTSDYKHVVELDKSEICDYIERYCYLLEIKHITNIVINISKKAEEMYILSECIPTSIAAGSIYYVCLKLKLNITKKIISNVTKLSDVTVNKTYTKLLPYDKELIESNEELKNIIIN